MASIGELPSDNPALAAQAAILARPATAERRMADAIRALAISDTRRSEQLPDVPTVAEAGYPGFQTLTWNGLLAPAATPRPIVELLANEIRAAVKDAKFLERLRVYGVDPLGNTPAEFTTAIASDIKMWTDAVSSSGLAAK